YAVDPNVDYSQEPMTLVEFQLEEAPGGIELRIVESGFDRIPLARRAEAWRMNDGGWAIQASNIERHVTSA
ncbi:MAG TPA: vanillate O-demethylase oxidoreductase VanB, partial [Polyangiaceae bacterium]|nr:vanillate O-demethylase oxidoreductase VanB [Polyangiaceae bacterium]